MGGHGFDISCKTPHTHKKEGGPGALGNGRLGARSATGLTLAMGGLSQRGGPSRMGGTEKGTGGGGKREGGKGAWVGKKGRRGRNFSSF